MPDPRALLTGQDPTSTQVPMSFAPVNGQRVPVDDGSSPAPTPDQIAAILGPMRMAPSHTPGALVPPQQTSQPPLVVSHASTAPAVDPQTAWQGAQTIGPSRVGERYLPAPISEILGSDHPVQDFIGHVMGGIRPQSVASQDPYGIKAWEMGAGPMPAMAASMEPIEGPGLYSRLDAGVSRIPEKGVHPNKALSLLQGGEGVSQEELAYRGVPEFLAAKGNQPVTRAELQAHLQANPAPFPQTTVLGAGNPQNSWDAFVQRMESRYGEGYDADALTPAEQQEGGRLWDQVNTARGSRNLAPRYATYALPGGENYQEHLYTLPQETALQGHYRVDITHNTGLTPPWHGENISPERLAQLRQQYTGTQGGTTPYTIHAEEMATPVPGYTEGHYGGDYPNLLTHVRTTERTLPGAPPPEPPTPVPQLTGADLHQQGWTVRVDREEPYSGRRQMTLLNPQGEWSGSRGMTPLTPEEYLHDHALGLNRQAQAAQAAQPTGPRGRFLEEVQSDWHQAGKRGGYQPPPTPEQQARLAQLPAEINSAQRNINQHETLTRQAHDAWQDRLVEETRARLPPEWAHLQNLSQALSYTDESLAAWRTAREQAMQQSPDLARLRTAHLQAEQRLSDAATRRRLLDVEQDAITNPTGVPDAPFKDSWPDLALKQQLLDVARDPHANWLGFTSGQTQAARYDLSKQVSKLTFEPDTPGDYSLGSLVAHDASGDEVMRHNRLEPHELDDYIGKEPASALRRQITGREHDDAQWTIERGDDNRYYVMDANGEPHGEGFKTVAGADEMRTQILRGEYYSDTPEHPSISGLDLKVGGEGMKHFYDKLLPARLQKLLKPFGGTVEPFQLPSGADRGYRIMTEYGGEVGRYDSLANAQAELARYQQQLAPRGHRLHIESPSTEPSWIAHLSPAMKAAILKKGFPLLTLPLAVGAASLASRPATPGEPPPQPPVPAPDRR